MTVLAAGTILDNRYEILEHIGSGGMADVYKARCLKLNRYVAIKVLKEEYHEDSDFVKRFQAEAQATAGLTHPNIVSIYDVGQQGDIYYIVMELAQGMTLKRYIRRYGRLSVRETVDFAIQIARGIQAAHEHHIIHRDIKPQNIMVSESGKTMVTDFGLARAVTGDTIATNAMGSVRYLSPEQARGGYADERSDIYSLGITIYEMATGKVPFDGDNSVTIALKHLQEEMTPPRCYFPDIPVSLEKIIMKCCMKQPAARYQSAAELVEDLQQVFLYPDGDYVFEKDMLPDDSPTIIRTTEEIDQINDSMEEQSSEEEKKEMVGLYEKKKPGDLPEEDDEDDVAINSKMQKMIMTIAIIVGIIFAVIIFYLIASTMHLLPNGLHKDTASTTATTEAASTTEVKTVKMPNLENFSKKEAEAKLKELSLTAVFTYEANVSSDQEDDEKLIVKTQSIDKGTKVPRGSSVELLLGWDPSATTTEASEVEVPALVNYSEEEAVELLESLNLNVEKAYATSDTVEAGYVLKQSPKGGSIVNAGFTVTITVSQGVAKTKVPSLYGLSQYEAEAELNAVDLKLGNVTSDYSGDVGIGDVISQSVASGTSVDKGSTVDVVVSLGEKETFTYEGDLYISESPFEDGESGKLKLVLEQGGKTKTIYNAEASADTFPLDCTFEGFSEGDGTVIEYVNGSEYDRYDVYLSAIAD